MLDTRIRDNNEVSLEWETGPSFFVLDTTLLRPDVICLPVRHERVLPKVGIFDSLHLYIDYETT